MQAMEQNRNDPQRSEAARAYPRPDPVAPESSAVVRWAAAGIVAAAALLGSVVLVFLIALALQPPLWVQLVLAVAMAVGAVVFAWLVAAALRDDDASQGRR